LNFDKLEQQIIEDKENNLIPLMMVYNIRDNARSIEEIPKIEELCLKYEICLYINGEETGMFCTNGPLARIKKAAYVSIGFTKLAGMTSTFLFIADKEELKKNLVSIGAEYYKSSLAEINVNEELLTKNKFCQKDYIIGFGNQTSLLKLLFYFEARGVEGFSEFLNQLLLKGEMLQKVVEESEKFVNVLRFENFVLADAKGEEKNEEFYKRVHSKYDFNLPELFGLYEFGGRKRLLFVANTDSNLFNENFVKETLKLIE